MQEAAQLALKRGDREVERRHPSALWSHRTAGNSRKDTGLNQPAELSQHRSGKNRFLCLWFSVPMGSRLQRKGLNASPGWVSTHQALN